MSSTQTHAPEIDAVTGTATTGHSWDGIAELNTPLPKWWLWIFYATIVWSFGYFVVYPSWPLATSHTTGVFGWTSRGEVASDIEDLKKLRSGNNAKLAAMPLADVTKDPQMLDFAKAQGKAAFGDNCAPCHGAGGGGAVGFPSLVDDDWLWGGKIDQIEQTIKFGVRSAHAETRAGAMTAFGTGSSPILKKDQIEQVADYVLTLSKQQADAKSAEAGKAVYAENCAVCHGDEGKGNQELGAPNLTDGIWLYGKDKAAIVYGVVNGRGGVMPNFAGRIDDATIKSLAVYVHQLGGGVK
ncbi:MAG: cytochrome-c oxidase, cbb3-type subunit III [Methylobacteriaceae bacterium]|nr:cytochrome-c oxidase, cbb3-type subunit III [Methylobacteriaceae bacterium]